MKRLLLTLACCALLSADFAKADVCGAAVGNLVANCGFETGTFANWTLSGTNSGTAYDGIAHGVDQGDAHSGMYGAYLGGFGGVLNLSQTIQTVPGTAYTVTYWLAQNPATVIPYQSSFSLSFGGSVLSSLSQLANLPYGQYTATTVASSPATSLVFGFRDDTGLFSIDDIVVTASPVPEPGTSKCVGSLLTLGMLSAALGRKRLSLRV